jgi:hypothetical protein
VHRFFQARLQEEIRAAKAAKGGVAGVLPTIYNLNRRYREIEIGGRCALQICCAVHAV